MADAAKKLSENEIQDICRGVVERNVLVRQNQAIEAFIKVDDADGFYEVVENLYQEQCPHCGEDHSGDEDEDGEDGTYLCSYCKESFDDPEQEPKEVYEWWAVTDWLARKLKERGCVMFDSGDCKIWGRCCTGQAILLDSVIREIALEFPNA